MKRYIKWLTQDGLIIQVFFGIAGAIMLGLGVWALFKSVYDGIGKELPFIIFVFFLGIVFTTFGFLWSAVAFFHPEHKLAKIGMRWAPGDVSTGGDSNVVGLIIILLLFTFAAAITSLLRLVGIRGYRIQYYSKFYEP